jgi:hypothetical protein
MEHKNNLPSEDNEETIFHQMRRCLNTPDGKALLAHLCDTLMRGDLRGENVRDTYFNLGQRAVVEDLLFISEMEKNDGMARTATRSIT